MIWLIAFLFPIFIFAFGTYLIFKGAKRFLLVQRIENTPTSKTQSAAIGLVELHGKAASEKPLESPISKAGCVFWAVHAYQFDPFHNDYKLIARAEARSTFDLVDQSGRIRVSPGGAEFELSETNVDSSFLTSMVPDAPKMGVFQSTNRMSKMAGDSAMDFIRSGISDSAGVQDSHYIKNENLRSFIRSNAALQSAISRFAGRNIRVVEFIVHQGQEIYVIGSLDIKPGDTPILCKRTEEILFISDEEEPELIKALRFRSLKGIMFGWILLAASVTLFIVLSQNIL